MENDYEILYLASEDMETAVDILLKKYSKLLSYKALKYSSANAPYEDCLNEAKLTLYEAVESYQDNIKFSTYLNTCLDNNLINYKKSLERKKYKSLNEAESLDENISGLSLQYDDERYNPEKILLEEEHYLEQREKIISNLTWKEELIFNLKEQNYSVREISEITDNNLRTVYNIINRIKSKVYKLMSN